MKFESSHHSWSSAAAAHSSALSYNPKTIDAMQVLPGNTSFTKGNDSVGAIDCEGAVESNACVVGCGDGVGFVDKDGDVDLSIAQQVALLEPFPRPAT